MSASAIHDKALLIEAKLSRLEKNQEVEVTPAKTDKVKPPAFKGKFEGIEKTEITTKDYYPFPIKIILVSQPVVGRKEPKIIRIPNFLIDKIKQIQ